MKPLAAFLNNSFRERFARNFDRLKIFVFVSVIRQRWNLADNAFGEKYLFDLVLGDWPPFRLRLNVSLESFEQALLFCWRQLLDLGEQLRCTHFSFHSGRERDLYRTKPAIIQGRRSRGAFG